LKKADTSKTDPYIGLLEYRTTLLSDTGFSLSKLLMSRGLRSVLSCTLDRLVPHTHSVSKANDKMNLSRTKQIKYYDIGAKTLKPLQHENKVKTSHSNQQSLSIYKVKGRIQYALEMVLNTGVIVIC
jgi:hypothetical protein